MPTITGTAADDTLNGTAGNEEIQGLAGNDTINGDSGDDLLYGGDGNDTLNGGDGNDILDGGNGNDLMDGGAGIDTVSYASANQYVWIDLNVTWPYDTRGGHLDGMINVENVVGSNFDDRLIGNQLSNQINGGAGNDFIVAGQGDDLLTGGGGDDHFLFSVGDGQDTITDFATGDKVSFDGYPSPQSVTQNGSNVVVVFSATDRLTFLNTDIATVEAFLPQTTTFTQPPSTIIPLLPTRPGATTATGTVVLNGSPTVTIAADQVYHGIGIDPTFGPYGSHFRAGWGSPLIFTNHEFVFDWQLINQGTIWNSSKINHVNSVWADNVSNSGTIVAEVGPFDPPGDASMQYFIARAVVLLGRTTNAGLANPALNNSGQIFAIADHGSAIAVYSEAPSNGFVNSGLIAAHATYGEDHSQTGGAQGIRMQNGGYFVNEASGRILVEGDALAYAVYQGRGSHPAAAGNGAEIVNRGLIQAVVGSEAARPSVGIFAVNLEVELMRIVNSGTIKADIAIYCPSDPANTFTTSMQINAQTVTNQAGGLIEGKIQLEMGNDTLINAGTIRGTVDMGGNDDLVDNSAGLIEGVVLLGDGNDNFVGGASADHASGGTGNDSLSGGGGADLLEGNFGDDTLVGGAGNDGLYGGNGNDVLRTLGGDVARGNYGNDRIEAGDYAFAQINGGAGYDIWILPSGARSLNLAVVAASGRVLGIEEIDLRGGQTVVVQAADVVSVSGGNALHLRGSGTDAVYLAGSWTGLGSIVENGVTYARYQSDNSVVFVEAGVQVSIGSAPPAAGGLDAIAGGTAAPPPSADAEQPVYWVSGYQLVADIVFSADDIWKSPDGAAVLVFAYVGTGGQLYDAPNIFNYGQMINDAGTGVYAITVGGLGGTMNFELFSNYGIILSQTQGTTTDAYAFVVGSRGRLVNDGDVVAIADGNGDATGVATWDSSFEGASVSNLANGYIGALSQNGWAVGIYGANAPLIENGGLIEAVGGTGAIGVDLANSSHGRLVNNGEIYAAVIAGGSNASIGVSFYDGGSVTNSGIIAADIAIWNLTAYGLALDITNTGQIFGAILMTPYWEDSDSAMLRLNNSGLIVGDIIVDPDVNASLGIVQWNGQSRTINDLIINTGRIEGDISLAEGADIYDGTNGELLGIVDGGAGNDVVIGWSDNDQFYGGDGNDSLSGNAGNDILTGGTGTDALTGGAGADIFRDMTAGLSGDTITDLGAGDKIVISDANLASFTFSLSGNTLTFTGGSLTLTGFTGQLQMSAAAGGGVQLTVVPVDARSDFNGDGFSDVLWRRDSGMMTNWLGQSNGGFSYNDANARHDVSTDWQIAGIGDFNGDNRDDILWRRDSGMITNWLGQTNGGFSYNDANALNHVATDWQVAGVGDFNGDQRDDILWRRDNGQMTNWLGQANGGFTYNDANALNQIATDWQIAGVGDFNGDGYDDILWRRDSGLMTNWLGQANGGFIYNDANARNDVSTDWQIAGVGDFNGDNRDDILWRRDNGQLTNWLGQANGGFSYNDANALNQIATDWHIAGIGDFNGDRRDDILWRNDSGQMTNWLGAANGGFTYNDANARNLIATDWHIQAPDILWV